MKVTGAFNGRLNIEVNPAMQSNSNDSSKFQGRVATMSGSRSCPERGDLLTDKAAGEKIRDKARDKAGDDEAGK